MAKETSLLQADIKQLITGPVMNGIVLDMVGNDWTVDTNGNRFIINEQVISAKYLQYLIQVYPLPRLLALKVMP